MRISTENKHMVGIQGGKVLVMSPPREPMSGTEALALAAWLIVMCGADEAEVTQAVNDVGNT